MDNQLAWQHLVRDHTTNHMAHAYLFTGPQGLGKASTAKEYIKYLLQANNVLAKRIDENNFLDLLYLSKQDKNEITIDLIRKAHDFFNQTPAECQYKFVIIDPADDLNLNAANALLKIIEEPKQNTYLFLISHIPHKILATIRSRCRIISFKPLKHGIDCELEDLVAGSPGKALVYNKLNAMKLYKQLLELIQGNDIITFNKFADSLNKNPEQWNLVTDLLFYILHRCTKLITHSLTPEQLLEFEQDLLPKIAHKKSIEEWFQIYDELRASLEQTEIYNLDKKQILLFALDAMRN